MLTKLMVLGFTAWLLASCTSDSHTNSSRYEGGHHDEQPAEQ